MSWKRLNRNTLVDTKFLKVYEDTVELPDGTVIDDYTVSEKPSYIVIVATDEDNNLITLKEYQYAQNKTLNKIPGGHVKDNEDKIEAAKRELLEETGYTSNEATIIGEMYDYPSKDCHKGTVIRVVNARKTSDTHYEITEFIQIRLVSKNDLILEIKRGEWQGNADVAALTTSGIFFS